MIYDIILIGGGPAGLFAAYSLSRGGLKVLLVEKNQTLGRKLLITGSKQCNLTSQKPLKDFLKAYGAAAGFMKSVLKQFGIDDLMDFFEGIQIPLMIREDGKVFPKSLHAEDVVNGLVSRCQKQGVHFSLGNKCKGIQKESQLFQVDTTNGTYASKILVLTTGGSAYPQLGSSGESLHWIEGMGHKIVKPRPALSPAFIDSYRLKALSGLSFKGCIIDIIREGKTLQQVCGDLLLTHFGLSGPVILNNSRYMMDGDLLRVNFIGESHHDHIHSAWNDFLRTSKSSSAKSFYEGYQLPRRFVEHLLIEAEVSQGLSLAQWSKEQREIVFEKFLKYPMKIDHIGDMRMAMVTAGGVSRDDINPKTMSSKRIENLYFAGEVVDVDGETGGYNIQAAISMAYVASDAILKKLKKE